MTFMHQDYYAILGVSPEAESEVIVAAYKALALKYHPDRSHSPQAVGRMAQLNAAYEVLSDPRRRSDYDAAICMSTPGEDQTTNPAKAEDSSTLAPQMPHDTVRPKTVRSLFWGLAFSLLALVAFGIIRQIIAVPGTRTGPPHPNALFADGPFIKPRAAEPKKGTATQAVGGLSGELTRQTRSRSHVR